MTATDILPAGESRYVAKHGQIPPLFLLIEPISALWLMNALLWNDTVKHMVPSPTDECPINDIKAISVTAGKGSAEPQIGIGIKQKKRLCKTRHDKGSKIWKVFIQHRTPKLWICQKLWSFTFHITQRLKLELQNLTKMALYQKT